MSECVNPADFTVLADGTSQPIVAFASIDVPETRPPAEPAAWVRTVPPDVRTNAIARAPEGRLFVLLLDDGLIPADPAAIASAKRIARMAIDRLGSADQMAVVFTVGSRGAHFTSERGKLLAAVDTLQQGYASHLLGWDSAVFDDPAKRWILSRSYHRSRATSQIGLGAFSPAACGHANKSRSRETKGPRGLTLFAA